MHGQRVAAGQHCARHTHNVAPATISAAVPGSRRRAAGQPPVRARGGSYGRAQVLPPGKFNYHRTKCQWNATCSCHQLGIRLYQAVQRQAAAAASALPSSLFSSLLASRRAALQDAAGVRMRGLLDRVETLLSSDADPQVGWPRLHSGVLCHSRLMRWTIHCKDSSQRPGLLRHASTAQTAALVWAGGEQLPAWT